MTKTQSILAELHSIREQLLADSGGTLEGLVARLQREQKASGRIIRRTQQIQQCDEEEERPTPDQTNPSAS